MVTRRGWGRGPVPCSERALREASHPQGDHKGPHLSSSPLPPLQRHGTASSFFVVFVRAGVAWSGVGTLVVALGGVAASSGDAYWTPLAFVLPASVLLAGIQLANHTTTS